MIFHSCFEKNAHKIKIGSDSVQNVLYFSTKLETEGEKKMKKKKEDIPLWVAFCKTGKRNTLLPVLFLHSDMFA